MDLYSSIRMDSQEFEQLLAGCVLISPSNTVEEAGWLSPERIGNDKIRKFWTSVLDRKPFMEAAIEAGIYPDLIGWSTQVPASYHAGAFAKEIDRLGIMRDATQSVGNLVACLQTGDYDAYRKVLDGMYKQEPSRDELVPSATDLHLEFMSSIDNENTGISTYLAPLDDCLGGLDRQTMSILAARPSLGKTTLAWQIARTCAGQGKRVLYFSLEMTKMALWRKAACGAAGIDWRDLKNQMLSQEKKDHLIQTSVELMELYADNLLVDDRTSHTTQSIGHLVVRHKPDLFVVDVLARCKNKGEREVTRLGDIAYSLREIAKENGCHVIAVHHINREGAKREGHRPTMADLRESGELEQAADYVLLMDSDAYYEDNPRPRRIEGRDYFETKIIVAKNREGARGVDISLAFDVAQQWFEPGRILK